MDKARAKTLKFPKYFIANLYCAGIYRAGVAYNTKGLVTCRLIFLDHPAKHIHINSVIGINRHFAEIIAANANHFHPFYHAIMGFGRTVHGKRPRPADQAFFLL